MNRSDQSEEILGDILKAAAEAEEPGLLWRAPEDRNHDYDAGWDYEVRENSDPDLVRQCIQAAQALYRRRKQSFEVWDADLSGYDHIARYANGTESFPAIVIDLEAHRDYPDQILKTLDHELRHAIQEQEGRLEDDDIEEDAESDSEDLEDVREDIFLDDNEEK